MTTYRKRNNNFLKRNNRYLTRDRVDFSSPFIIEITTTSNNQSITLPLIDLDGSQFNFRVNWGDGSAMESFTTHTGVSHVYADIGVYNIEIWGTCEGWSVNNGAVRTRITDIINWGSGTKFSGFRYLAGGFYGCSNLKSFGPLNSEIKASRGGCKSFYRLFMGCTAANSAIHENLFAQHPLCTTFSETFRNARVSVGSTIPANLFINNTEVTTFLACFYGLSNISGSIPATLFRNNIKVTNFGQLFYSCSNLTGAIPVNLFSTNTEVTTFSQAFYGCVGLTEIPEQLFTNNTKVAFFSQTFYICSGITAIPANLFKNNTLVTSFNQTFYLCQNIQGEIPQGFFANNLLVTSFNETFYTCDRLAFNKLVFVNSESDMITRFLNRNVNFTRAFFRQLNAETPTATAPELWNCNFGTGTPTRTGCFSGSGNTVDTITNFNEIPAQWK